MPSNSLTPFMRDKRRKEEKYSNIVFNSMLENIRRKRGDNYKETAEFLRVSVSFLYRVRKGKRKSEPLYNRVKTIYRHYNPIYYVAYVWKSSKWYWILWKQFDSYNGAKEFINQKIEFEDKLIDYIITFDRKLWRRFIAKWYNRLIEGKIGYEEIHLKNEEEVLAFLNAG